MVLHSYLPASPLPATFILLGVLSHPTSTWGCRELDVMTQVTCQQASYVEQSVLRLWHPHPPRRLPRPTNEDINGVFPPSRVPRQGRFTELVVPYISVKSGRGCAGFGRHSSSYRLSIRLIKWLILGR